MHRGFPRITSLSSESCWLRQLRSIINDLDSAVPCSCTCLMAVISSTSFVPHLVATRTSLSLCGETLDSFYTFLDHFHCFGQDIDLTYSVSLIREVNMISLTLTIDLAHTPHIFPSFHFRIHTLQLGELIIQHLT